jgi:hypothetical protein
VTAGTTDAATTGATGALEATDDAGGVDPTVALEDNAVTEADEDGGGPTRPGYEVVATLVQLVITSGEEQKTLFVAPIANVNAPTAVPHASASASLSVTFARATLPVFVTVIFQKTVFP